MTCDPVPSLGLGAVCNSWGSWVQIHLPQLNRHFLLSAITFKVTVPCLHSAWTVLNNFDSTTLTPTLNPLSLLPRNINSFHWVRPLVFQTQDCLLWLSVALLVSCRCLSYHLLLGFQHSMHSATVHLSFPNWSYHNSIILCTSLWMFYDTEYWSVLRCHGILCLFAITINLL